MCYTSKSNVNAFITRILQMQYCPKLPNYQMLWAPKVTTIIKGNAVFKEWSDKSIHFALAGGSTRWQVVSTLRSMTEDTYLTPTLHTLNRTEPDKHSSPRSSQLMPDARTKNLP